MSKCVKCGKKNHLQMKCKWCELFVCTKCIQVEVHDCVQLEKCIQSKTYTLNKMITDQRVVSVKVQHI